MLSGTLAAIALVVFIVPGAVEHVITGSMMVAMGLGWGLLAVLSARFTDQSQRWALVPGAYLTVVGAGLVAFAPSADTLDLLGWVWPPVLLALAIWMIRQARQRLRSRARAWLVYPLCVVLGLAGLGGIYATVSEAVASDTLPTAGQLVDVGGHRLYLSCTGSGSPTVILQAGLGGSSADWDLVATAVASDTTVCAYDRAGRGHSEPPPELQDGTAIADDLHALLENAGVAGPYVLVGHSSGGVYVQIFADKYPGDVAGMVLLDAQPAAAFTGLPDYPAFYSRAKIGMGLLPPLARMGLARVADARSLRDEFIQLPKALEQGRAVTTLGDIPLIVVTALSGSQEGWLPLQEQMATLSTNSAHRVFSDASHESLIKDEADATEAIGAIRDVVAAVRTGTPLPGS